MIVISTLPLAHSAFHQQTGFLLPGISVLLLQLIRAHYLIPPENQGLGNGQDESVASLSFSAIPFFLADYGIQCVAG